MVSLLVFAQFSPTMFSDIFSNIYSLGHSVHPGVMSRLILSFLHVYRYQEIFIGDNFVYVIAIKPKVVSQNDFLDPQR